MAKHIEDIIRRGTEVEVIVDGSEGEQTFRLWLSKPTPAEHQKASLAARAAQAAKRVLLSDSDGFREVIEQDIPDDYDEVLEIVVSYESENLNRRAYEEVLHNPDVGSNWGDDGGLDLLSLLDAMAQRAIAIQEHNENIEDEADHLGLEDDEQYVALNKKTKQFFDEVDARAAELREDELDRLRVFSYDELKRMAVDKYVDLEARAAWYDEYRYQVIYHACHYADNKKRKYFSSVEALKGLDEYIFMQLWSAFEGMSVQGDDLKK